MRAAAVQERSEAERLRLEEAERKAAERARAHAAYEAQSMLQS
jgi:hypothetical protein